MLGWREKSEPKQSNYATQLKVRRGLDALQTVQSSLSVHLKVLKGAGVIHDRPQGPGSIRHKLC